MILNPNKQTILIVIIHHSTLSPEITKRNLDYSLFNLHVAICDNDSVVTCGGGIHGDKAPPTENDIKRK
jgi:hypothetical protein